MAIKAVAVAVAFTVVVEKSFIWRSLAKLSALAAHTAPDTSNSSHLFASDLLHPGAYILA